MLKNELLQELCVVIFQNVRVCEAEPYDYTEDEFCDERWRGFLIRQEEGGAPTSPFLAFPSCSTNYNNHHYHYYQL